MPDYKKLPKVGNEAQRTPEARRKKINTLESLRDYIKRQLGYPLIQIEVTDEQIEDCIFSTIDEFSEYGLQGMEEYSLFVTIDNDQRTFILDDRVRAITKIRSRSNISNTLQLPGGWVLSNTNYALSFLSNLGDIDLSSICIQMSRLSMIQSLFDVPINYTFNENTKELKILETPKSDTLLLELALHYEPKQQDNIYGHTWIKKCATSKVKYQWGMNIGKFSTSLVNGATINYDRIISEAQQELQEHKEELLETYREPLGIYVC